MTDEFDDDALRDAIGSRSGGPVETGAARQAIIARAHRTRTLRTAAIGGSATFVVIVGFLLLPTIRRTPDAPADEPAAPVVTPSTITQPPVTTIRPTDTTSTMPAPMTTITPSPTTIEATTPTSTVTAIIDTTTAPPGDSPITPSTAPSPQPTPAPTTTPTSSSPPSTTTPSTTTSPSVPTTSTTADPSDPPFTRQYDSPGGSITVDWNGSALSLVAVVANSGYEAEIEDESATRIRVRFRGDDDFRIEVRANDGKVEYSIS